MNRWTTPRPTTTAARFRLGIAAPVIDVMRVRISDGIRYAGVDRRGMVPLGIRLKEGET